MASNQPSSDDLLAMILAGTPPAAEGASSSGAPEGLLIRRAGPRDLWPLLELYPFLGDNPLPNEDDLELSLLWTRILMQSGYHILLGFVGDTLASTCTALVIDNLTHGQRPYMLIENVVTHPDFRRRGYGAQMLQGAVALAKTHGCYKAMLMTGSKEESTLDFYRQAGFNSTDKTGFVQWLD